MNINPFGLGAGLILVGLIADRKKLMRSVALEAHEGDDYMAEKLTKSKINYDAWAKGQRVMDEYKSFNDFLVYLGTGAKKRDTQEQLEQTIQTAFKKDYGEQYRRNTQSFYGGDKSKPIVAYDLVTDSTITEPQNDNLITRAMADYLGRTRDSNFDSQFGMRLPTSANSSNKWRFTGKTSIPHKRTGKGTSKSMDIEYKWDGKTVIGLAKVESYTDSSRVGDCFIIIDGNKDEISENEYSDLKAKTIPIYGGENYGFNLMLLNKMRGDERITDEAINEARKGTLQLKSNLFSTLTDAENKSLRDEYTRVFLYGGINPITGREVGLRNHPIWDETKKYDGQGIPKGYGLDAIVYALKCSQILPNVKMLRKSSSRRNATYKPMDFLEKTSQYDYNANRLAINNYDFMPHLKQIEKWAKIKDIADKTPQLQRRIDNYQARIDDSQAIIDKYESMNIQEEINTRVNALKAQLMGEYGLEREKQQAMERAEREIKQHKSYLKQEQDKLESLMNS